MRGQVPGQLTLFQEGFLVNPFPRPGSAEAGRMTAISGQKWSELSKNSGRLGLLERMLLESLEWHSPIFWLNWKPVDIGQGRFLFQLALSEPDTEDTGLQLWATPNTMDYMPQRSPEALRKLAEGKRKGRKRPANLREQVDQETMRRWQEPAMWKTPVTSDAADRKMYVNSRGEPNLSGQVKLWPTPTAQDYKRRGPNSRQQGLPEQVAKMYNTPTAQDAKNCTLPLSQIKRNSLVGDVMREMFATPQARDWKTGQASRWEDREHRSRNLNDQIAMYPTPTTGAGLCGGTGNYQQLKKLEAEGKITEEERRNMSRGNGGSLNPEWVEWLMGFPAGWTDIGT